MVREALIAYIKEFHASHRLSVGLCDSTREESGVYFVFSLRRERFHSKMIKSSISVAFLVLCVWCLISICTATPVPAPEAKPEPHGGFGFGFGGPIGFGGYGPVYYGGYGPGYYGRGFGGGYGYGGGFGGGYYGGFRRYPYFYPPIAILAG